MAKIGDFAFNRCTGLTSITIGEGNTMFDSRNNCNAIIETASNTLIAGCRNTVIPNSVMSIAVGAFECCNGITSVTIPNSVTKIGGAAFADCTDLTSVTNYAATPQSLDSYAFGNVPFSKATLYVPKSSVEAYKTAKVWKDINIQRKE